MRTMAAKVSSAWQAVAVRVVVGAVAHSSRRERSGDLPASVDEQWTSYPVAEVR
jgi:hypothetical protein